VVVGDVARDDHTVTDLLARLRADANWAYLRPRRGRLRKRFFGELQRHLDRAEPGSLAGLVRSAPATSQTAPDHQVAHWLFAFDAAGMASYRALALLDAHPKHAKRVRDELGGQDLSAPEDLPFLRACVLESLRLWPTTPGVLRDTTTETSLGADRLPAGTAILIFAPFFHRDDQRLTYADSFSPDVWLDGDPSNHWPLIPFSAGPAGCPGRNLVLLVTSHLLATLLAGHECRQEPPKALDGVAAMPATLSPFALRFELLH
jgi:cytochrome P450